MQEESSPRRLYRSRREKMVAGVAGGLAQYIDIDPVLIRLAFVFFAFTGALGLLAYIALAIVMPERPADEPEPEITGTIAGGRGREIVGLLLLVLGAILLVGNLGYFAQIQWQFVWPLAIIALGVALLVMRR